MSEQRHIINKQILELHVPEGGDVNAIQEEFIKLYHDKIIQIINDLCDRHSAPGTHCKIEKLTIDLGNIQPDEFEEQFAQQFSEAIASKEVVVLSDASEETGGVKAPKTPLDVLSYYLLTGTMPWWAASSTKGYLENLLDGLNDAPNAVFIALLKEVAQKKECLNRFLFTFSEAQIQKSFRVLTALPSHDLLNIREEMIELVLSKPLGGRDDLTENKVKDAFWAAVFAHATIANDHSNLMEFAIAQTLRTLGIDVSKVMIEVQKNSSGRGLIKWMGGKVSPSLSKQTQIHQQVKAISRQNRDNPLIRAFCKQLLLRLNHPLFSRIDATEIEVLARLLKELEVAQSKGGSKDAKVSKVLTEEMLTPLSIHIHQLDSQLQQMSSTSASNVMETLHSSYDETDFISIENAGLVILWPFLQRFFNNLELLEERIFANEATQHKAACVLQYLATEEEDEIFEGLLSLNKVLCGIDFGDTIALEPLTDEDKAMAEGLLQAVIAQGPLWKNLSLSGLRSSYLQREGLLRTRDGHWLLQVKKETHDITLEKLPWSFNTVKLPWMNAILIVEWI